MSFLYNSRPKISHVLFRVDYRFFLVFAKREGLASGVDYFQIANFSTENPTPIGYLPSQQVSFRRVTFNLDKSRHGSRFYSHQFHKNNVVLVSAFGRDAILSPPLPKYFKDDDA